MMKPGVAEALAGQTMLVTGASGFLGKAMLEKLLRTCPKIKKIYVVLRARRGKEPRDRLRELLDGPVSNILSENEPTKHTAKHQTAIGRLRSLTLSP